MQTNAEQKQIAFNPFYGFFPLSVPPENTRKPAMTILFLMHDRKVSRGN